MLLDKQVNGMAAGGDDDVTLFLAEHSLIFGFNDGSTDSGLLNIVEAQLLQCFAHGLDTDTLIVCDERGSKAHNNGVAALEEHSYLLGLVYDFLCILGTYNEALSAKDTLISYNVRLVSRKADSLYGTIADALVAVFAV